MKPLFSLPLGLAAIAMLGLSASVLAEPNYHYVCTQAPDVRIIEVAYLVPEQKVPCEVRYKKEDAESSILWRADNQEGFCESRAQYLVEKQREWGFECKSDNAPSEPINLSLQVYNNL